MLERVPSYRLIHCGQTNSPSHTHTHKHPNTHAHTYTHTNTISQSSCNLCCNCFSTWSCNCSRAYVPRPLEASRQKSARPAQKQDMQSTSDITAKNTEYPVNLMYPLLYPAQRNDEARTADWCAALSDATSSVEGTDPQSEESDQAQLPNEELVFDK